MTEAQLKRIVQQNEQLQNELALVKNIMHTFQACDTLTKSVIGTDKTPEPFGNSAAENNRWFINPRARRVCVIL